MTTPVLSKPVTEFATLKEAKAKCKSYYDLYDQLRNCTCGQCVIKDVSRLYKGFKSRNNMDEREILQKAIDKAERNGYEGFGMPRGFATYSVIFSHGFAKAFWGEHWLDVDYPFYASDIRYDGKIILETTKYVANLHITSWQYHLQQMVLEHNPIKYLERFL